MRLLIHQALKDLRAVRSLALVWLLLVAVYQAFTVYLAHVPAREEPALAAALIGYAVVQAAVVGLFAAIAVIIVQGDPAVGTTAFWFTRPISLPVLLGGKAAATFLLLVGFPILADVIGMLAGGLSFGDALTTLPASLLTQLAWLVPLLALAAITVNLAQFVLAALVEALLFVAGVFALREVIFAHPALVLRGGGVLRGAEISTQTLMVVLVVGLMAFGCAVLACAYRTRTLRRPAAIAGVAPVALAAVLFVWPWGFSSWRYRQVSSPITAAAVPGSFAVTGERGDVRLAGAFRFSNVPPRQALRLTALRAWIDYGSERVELLPGGIISSRPQQLAGSLVRAVRDAVGTATLIDPRSGQASAAGFVAPLARDAYDRHRNESGVFHAEVRVVADEEQVAAVVPARAGEGYRFPEHAARIAATSNTPEALRITLRDVSPRTFVAPDGEPLVVYALRDPAVGLAVLPARTLGTASIPSVQPPIPAPAHLGASAVSLEFPWPEQVPSNDWTRGAQLVVVDSRTLGVTTVHVTIPDFVLSFLK